MAITTDDQITWSELISLTKAKLKNNIENLSGMSIPNEFTNNRIELSHVNSAHSYATGQRNWTTVAWSTVENDFNSFLNYCNLNSTDRQDQIVSTRLILNFLENVSLFYNNRLVIVYSSIGAKPKKLYYYNDGSAYSSWAGKVTNIEDPVIDKPVTAEEINTAMTSIDANLKNKAKTYSQNYTYTSTCSCSSSCSSCSSSSSSSCCSCLTIVHQDLSML